MAPPRRAIPRHAAESRRVAYEPAGSRAPEASPVADEHATAWGGAFARFEDVDQNSFALVSFDEISRAVEAQRRASAEKREAERRAAQELEIARQVQARLFPQRLPELESLEYAGASSRRTKSVAITTTFSISARRGSASCLATSRGRGSPRRC